MYVSCFVTRVTMLLTWLSLSDVMWTLHNLREIICIIMYVVDPVSQIQLYTPENLVVCSSIFSLSFQSCFTINHDVVLNFSLYFLLFVLNWVTFVKLISEKYAILWSRFKRLIQMGDQQFLLRSDWQSDHSGGEFYCTLLQSAVLGLHVVRLSVRDVGGLGVRTT